MSELKLPTVGRVVHYFPKESDPHCKKNNAEVLPATVVQTFGTHLNLAVTCMNPDGPVVLRYSVPHKSIVDSTLGDVGSDFSYWDWPEIK